jgi:DNA-binding response OmpR family regulator
MDGSDDRRQDPILVVEDDESLRILIVRILELAGHRTVAVGEAELALAHLRHTDFGAVVLDNRLPGMTGVELIGEMRCDRGAAMPPVILVTGDDSITASPRWIEIGATDYLAKPFEAADLVSRVEAALRRRPAVKSSS